ncbi:type I secretion system permease/ATPase [Vibrio sp. vnigr-6D03]|uniref:type I secretion system permease/ATPase n=1 Tax=Vibrio sp. vnigr-6D03 TaxID=2058088 RepID=UPI000C32DEBD|nr:type I secretion system permease/ATPase [Vibrio sp. vnigr-6D03]PKF78785.1 type I secretion system permease/ATPase [Vibrio sp. vnigr-6D03]
MGKLYASTWSCIHVLFQLSGNEVESDFFKEEKESVHQLVKRFSKVHKVKVKVSRCRENKLSSDLLPLAFLNKDGTFSVLANLNEEQALIQEFDSENPQVISREELSSRWNGKVIKVVSGSLNFDVSWFIPEFVKHKKLLGEIVVFSLFLQLLALILPLFFQVIMDKVLIHSALSTLDVLVFTLLIVGVFEVILKGLREYILAHTCTRIDIHLGTKLYEHLMKLPLLYFKTRQTGAIVTRVRELDTIRNLLTSAALTLFIDITFTFVFIAVMFYLSPTLTYLVLATFPFYFIIAWLSSKPIKSKIERQFSYSAQNTAFLTETVKGVNTLKSLVLEPNFKNKWDYQSRDIAQSSHSLQKLQTLTSQCVLLLQKLSTVIVIWVGSSLVMALEMTIGQMIAFNMMVGHVTQPVAKLVELWQQFIQTRVAVHNLGDVLSLPAESSQNENERTKKIRGKIVFEDVWFRYQPQLSPVLKGINFSVSAGESVGIVGSSGSGKSTITKLIQKLYIPESGNILFDGVSSSEISTDFLRKNIGVVLQENYMFSKTVRENIAIRCPFVSLEYIVKAAKLAGAHDFITGLSNGYDTVLSEGGGSLSGGQRQRIAIARALISQPSILIFDEATSALDDESQRVIQENMKVITQGRTTITVAHRLSTIKHCNKILVLEKGEIAEMGNHDELIDLNGCYSRLWNLQKDFQLEESI